MKLILSILAKAEETAEKAATEKAPAAAVPAQAARMAALFAMAQLARKAGRLQTRLLL